MFGFDAPPHDWDAESTETTKEPMIKLFVSLTRNLKLSSIPPERLKVVFEGMPLHYFIAAVDQLPDSAFVTYGVEQIEAFDSNIYHLRDSRESLPHDGMVLDLFDSSTVMSLYAPSSLDKCQFSDANS